ncbi:MAG: hypothetical protein QNL87_10525, partial [Gammaproteobacteria bacterium]|nr:hypothetical protein [Gammaproteobacteria bacterium]
MNLNFKKHVLPVATLLAAVAASPLQAASVTFNYDQSFGAVSPDGPAPWATATFDDSGGAGSVTLTMSVAGTVGGADVTGMYFNLLDDSQATLDGLSFIFGGSSTGPAANSVSAVTNNFQADGDGIYDILFDFPPPGNRFGPGEQVVYTITDTAMTITAADFNVFGEPGPGAGNPGPFLSVARFQSTPGGGSDWVGAVPVPAAVWL